MGQKVNPHGIRVGVIKDWDSRWYTSKRDFGDTLVEDYKIRKVLKKQLYKMCIRDRAAYFSFVFTYFCGSGDSGGIAVVRLRRE